MIELNGNFEILKSEDFVGDPLGLSDEMKQEFVVMSLAFEENRKAYEKKLRRFLLKHIDECIPIDEDINNDKSFDKLRHLLFKTKIFQDSYVDINYDCTSNFEQLERLTNWLIDSDSDPDYEVDTFEITKEVFDKTPVSVKELLFSQIEYNLNMYNEVHAVEKDETSVHWS
jgi:hypothetical protein